MKQRFAPLALLFGMIAALMLGGTSMALAHGNPHSGFNCNNVGVNLVTCSKVITAIPVNIPVVVNITDNDTDVLSNNDLSVLEDSLNHVYIDLNVLNINNTLQNISVAVLNVYPVTVTGIQLCIGSVCTA